MKAVSGHRNLAKRGDIFYFRRAVPKEARHLFGNRAQIWQSLGTSDLAVARSKLQPLVDEFENVIAKARGEVAPSKIARAALVPNRQAIERAVRNAFLERVNRTRSFNLHDPSELEAARRRLEELRAFIEATQGVRGVEQDSTPMDVFWQAEALCEENGWPIDRKMEHWPLLVDYVARAQIEAATRELQALEGRPGSVADAAFAPEAYSSDAPMALPGPVSIIDLFDEYVAENRPSPRTIKSFRGKVKAFVAFVGHQDAAQVTKQDVVRWKDHLLAGGGKLGEGLNAKTVRATYLSALRTVLQRGAESGQLSSNVAVGVTVAGSRRTQKLRQSSFTDEEALRILEATLEVPRSRLSVERKLALRWIPWICAYTGARVNEISQLRREDIVKVDGVWTIRITPEAGSTKDGNARTIALHSHLVEQGFIRAIDGREGPLFYDPARSRNGSVENPQAKKVGEFLARWVRHQVGIDDPNVQPNHAWRHKFKSIAREIRMQPDIRDYIQGHAPRTEGEGYGEVSVKATMAEIERIPRFASATGCTD